MNFLHPCLSLLLFQLSYPGAGCGVSNTRIVGGQEATENQFPWQCAILDREDIFFGCGATLISCDPLIILTAAQCFEGKEM